MRQLEREKRGIFYARYAGKEQLLDERGMMTGEWRIKYSKPEFITATVSPRRGNTWGNGFGIGVNCDRTMVIDRIGTGLDETCVFWVDIRPQVDGDGELVIGEDGLPTTPNDYMAVMVAESYNYTSVAIKKAE